MPRFLQMMRGWPLLALVALVVPVGAGCSSGPDAQDVTMVYCRKQTEHQPAVVERIFNASHTEWVDKRSDRRATMLVPDGDNGYEISQKPDDLVIPATYQSKLEIRAKDDRETGPEDPHVIYWTGEMTYDEYSELRGASEDREWQMLIATIYRGAREVEATPEGLGYNPADLPPGTFAAEDDVMRAVPKAFHELHFFQHGLAAPSESRAQSWFESRPEVRECLILTVDGETTVLPLPSMADCNNNEYLFRERHEEYHKCQKAFAHIASRYRPASVRVGSEGYAEFDEERDRLRRRAEQERKEMKRRSEEANRNSLEGGN